MKAVITVTGKDTSRIIARVSTECADNGVNILDITQSVLGEYFAMIMLVDLSALCVPFAEFVDQMTELGKANALDIRTMHEEVFSAMHRI